MSEPIQSISQGNYILQGTVATSAGIVGDGTTQNPLRADETVLYSGAYSTTTTSINLSENVSGFDKIKVLWQHNNDTNARRIWLEYPNDTYECFVHLGRCDDSAGRVLFEAYWKNNGTSMTKRFCRWNYMSNGTQGTGWTDANELVPIKVIGINRKAQ